MKKMIFFIVTIFFFQEYNYSQNTKLDSLKSLYSIASQDSIRCRLLLNIGKTYKQIMPDSAIKYYKIAYNIAKNNSNKGDIFILNSAIAMNSLGWIESNYKGDYSISLQNTFESINLFNTVIQNSKKIDLINKAKLGLASSFNNIGSICDDQGRFDKSVEFYLKSLRIFEELENKKGISGCYLNLGTAHWNQNSYDKANEYYKKSFKNFNDINDKYGMMLSLMNLGNIYSTKKKFDSAFAYFEKSLNIAEEINDKKCIPDLYNNIGNIYKNKADYINTLKYYSKSIKLYQDLENKTGLATTYGNIAELHLLMAKKESNFVLKNKLFHLNSAIKYGELSFRIAKEISNNPRLNDAAYVLTRAYKMVRNYKKSLEFAELYIATKDSMFVEEKTRSIADAEKKFESKKKQLQIEKLNKEKELQQSELLRQQETGRRQKLIIIFVVLGIIFITAFAIFIINRLQITKKQKLIIEEQKEIVDEKNLILNQQNEEIRTQRDEIETQNIHLEKAYTEIEHKNKNITDSIKYALRIQSAILPPQELINHLVPDTFVLYKPKSIVSGDFYYLESKDDHIYFAAVDCTGHGVPGAFMSIVGYNLLNQALNEKNITEPHLMLNYLSEAVSKTLRQNDADSSLRDGMDLVLCRLNKNTLNIKIAGVHNSLYLIRDHNLTEFKGDKWPIGKTFCDRFPTYNSHEYNLVKNDILYLFSDGFIDQFNSETGKKYTSARFKELLLQISNLPMPEQQKQLAMIFENWKGNSEQIDDVMVLGIKI